jgi:hypothetical protein
MNILHHKSEPRQAAGQRYASPSTSRTLGESRIS